MTMENETLPAHPEATPSLKFQHLIARLEKADGPDRELDAAIGAAFQIVDEFDPSVFTAPLFYRGDETGRIRIYAGKIDESVKHYKASRKARHFTGSFEAALTLLAQDFPYDLRAMNVEGSMEYQARVDYAPWNTGSTPAICIAALTARSATP